eukprot:symbB.v1.2.029857.t1/scaffold3312.1/size59238/2
MDLIACLDALTTTEVTSTAAMDCKDCKICLDNYANGDQVKTLGCGHVFHADCMEQWGQGNDGCQSCGKPWRPVAETVAPVPASS